MMASSRLLSRRPISKRRHRRRQLGLPLAAELLGQRYGHHRVVQGSELLQQPFASVQIRLYLLVAEQRRQILDVVAKLLRCLAQ